jgi:dolichyl-phosphate beta-glucosyltransferase
MLSSRQTSGDTRPALSIVIPAYNEEQRLPSTLARIQQYLAEKPWRFELLVVDDGSTDGTQSVVAAAASGNAAIRYVGYTPNHGKGHAVRYGMTRAEGERLLLCDADLSTPIEEIEKLWSRLDDGADIAIGSRALPDSNLAVHQPVLRELIGRTFNLVVRLMAVPGLADTQCGFKLFRRESASRLFPILTIDGWCFDVEALYLARRFGYRIDEVPVTWINSPSTKVNVLRDLRRTLTELFRIRWTWAFRDPVRAAGSLLAEGRPAQVSPREGP